MDKIFKLESIAQIHKMIGYEKPKHPLITLIETSQIKPEQIPEIHAPILSDLFLVNLKNGDECKIIYGRQPYDFQEGYLINIKKTILLNFRPRRTL